MKSFHYLKPVESTKERVRAAFLAAYAQKFPVSASPSHAARYFVRGMATGMAAIGVFIGAGVYAEQNNVGPTNPLYPFKRSQEFLSLSLTDDSQKSALHLEFAERRLAEIEEIRALNPSHTSIADLKKSVRKEIEQSLAALEDKVTAAFITPNPLPAAGEGAEAPAAMAVSASLPQAERKAIALCESLGEFIGGEEFMLELLAGEDPSFIERYAEKCDVNPNEDDPSEKHKSGGGFGGNATESSDSSLVDDDDRNLEEGESSGSRRTPTKPSDRNQKVERND